MMCCKEKTVLVLHVYMNLSKYWFSGVAPCESSKLFPWNTIFYIIHTKWAAWKKPKSWADTGPLKEKYPVNAEKFKLSLKSDPFIS